jgi:hypothetical protein
MELVMLVESHGWGWLRLADRQLTVTVRVSYVSDVLADVIEAIGQAAEGAETAEARLGLEPGEAVLQIERRGSAWSIVRLQVEERSGPHGAVGFPVETSALARLGLDLAASVDRDAYLAAWAPEATWPTEGLERLAMLAQQ